MAEDSVIEETPDNTGSQESMTEALEARAVPDTPGLRLAKLAGVHLLVWMATLGLFAAADSWYLLTGLGIASFLGLLTGVLAGIATTNLIHEWFHYLGARFSGGAYTIPAKLGLFVYDWDFAANSRRQFFIMSGAGTLGGLVALILLFNAVPGDTLGRAALLGGAVASFVFGSCVEWPVLKRTRDGGEPFAELAKIDEKVLARSFVASAFAGVVMTLLITP